MKRLVVVLSLCGIVFAADTSGVWLDVPFVRQEKDGCGAASIAMVMQYWLKQQEKSAAESNPDSEAIQRALYSKEGHGIYASDVARYLQQHGFRTFAFQGSWEELKRQLEKGRPLIVALKPGDRGADLHYVVVAGLDWEHGIVLVNDPAERKLLKQERAKFEKQWGSAGKWTLLAVPQPAEHAEGGIHASQ